MSDRFAAEISIGGTIPQHLTTKFIKAIAATKAALAWGEETFTPATRQDLMAALNEDGVLALCDEERAWGEFEALEEFLSKHHLPFIRHHEAKYEYDAETHWLDQEGQEHWAITDQDGNQLVAAGELREALQDIDPIGKIKALLGPEIPQAPPKLEIFE